MQTDFSTFSYSPHVFWIPNIPVRKSTFGTCKVTGYCYFKNNELLSQLRQVQYCDRGPFNHKIYSNMVQPNSGILKTESSQMEHI